MGSQRVGHNLTIKQHIQQVLSHIKSYFGPTGSSADIMSIPYTKAQAQTLVQGHRRALGRTQRRSPCKTPGLSPHNISSPPNNAGTQRKS